MSGSNSGSETKNRPEIEIDTTSTETTSLLKQPEPSRNNNRMMGLELLFALSVAALVTLAFELACFSKQGQNALSSLSKNEKIAVEAGGGIATFAVITLLSYLFTHYIAPCLGNSFGACTKTISARYHKGMFPPPPQSGSDTNEAPLISEDSDEENKSLTTSK